MELLPLVGVIGAVLGGIALAWTYMRANTPKVWQETSEAYQRRAELLLTENVELRERVTVLEVRVEELAKRPDMTEILHSQTGLGLELAKVLTTVLAIRDEQKATP